MAPTSPTPCADLEQALRREALQQVVVVDAHHRAAGRQAVGEGDEGKLLARGPRPAAPLGKKRMNVGYVPPNARAASARRGTHVRDSGGVISGGRVTDYF